MPFCPIDARVPTGFHLPTCRVRPLTTEDLELDYAAVMSGRAMLRRWSQSEWPADDFTLQGDLEDLERHQREHEQREAFTYTVMNLDESRCLGCIYIEPIPEPLWEAGLPLHLSGHPDPYFGQIRFWVIPSLLDSGLDAKLLARLRSWIQDEWRFDGVLFHTSPEDEHQISLFGRAGLSQIDTGRLGVEWHRALFA